MCQVTEGVVEAMHGALLSEPAAPFIPYGLVHAQPLPAGAQVHHHGLKLCIGNARTAVAPTSHSTKTGGDAEVHVQQLTRRPNRAQTEKTPTTAVEPRASREGTQGQSQAQL